MILAAAQLLFEMPALGDVAVDRDQARRCPRRVQTDFDLAADPAHFAVGPDLPVFDGRRGLAAIVRRPQILEKRAVVGMNDREEGRVGAFDRIGVEAADPEHAVRPEFLAGRQIDLGAADARGPLGALEMVGAAAHFLLQPAALGDVLQGEIEFDRLPRRIAFDLGFATNPSRLVSRQNDAVLDGFRLLAHALAIALLHGDREVVRMDAREIEFERRAALRRIEAEHAVLRVRPDVFAGAQIDHAAADMAHLLRAGQAVAAPAQLFFQAAAFGDVDHRGVELDRTSGGVALDFHLAVHPSRFARGQQKPKVDRLGPARPPRCRRGFRAAGRDRRDGRASGRVRATRRPVPDRVRACGTVRPTTQPAESPDRRCRCRPGRSSGRAPARRGFRAVIFQRRLAVMSWAVPR